MHVSVRPAEARDLPILRDLFLRSRCAAFHWASPSDFALDDFDSQTEGEAILISEDHDRPTGFIAVWPPTNFIHHLHVDPRHVRRGIGQALLSALPEWMTVRYQLKCVSANQAALAFYLANGFFEVGSGRADNHDYRLLESAVHPVSSRNSKCA